MRILREPEILARGDTPVAAAIGVFDGLHVGHQEVIRRMLGEAAARGGSSLVVTFDRHPNAVVAPDRVPPSICSVPRRMKRLSAACVDACWQIRFDAAFSKIDAESFVTTLARRFGKLTTLCIGGGFTFGFRRRGNIDLLRSLGAQLGFDALAVETAVRDGLPVSSTRIRDHIRLGELAEAASCLGRAYSFAGVVVDGRRLARTLGFPTANLDTAGLVLPPNGVYAAWVQIEHEPALRPAVMNIGMRPTVNGDSQPTPVVEVHIPGWNGDLYGCELEVFPVRRLRDEKRFSSLDALREQISSDLRAATEAIIASTPPPAA